MNEVIAPDQRDSGHPTYLLLNRIISRAEDVALIGAGLATTLMMLLITIDVFLRYLFANPLTGASEMVSPYLMAAAVWLAIPYTQRKGRHVRVTLIKLSGWVGLVVDLIVAAAAILLFAAISLESLRVAQSDWGVWDDRTLVRLPAGLGVWCVIVGSVLLVLRLVVDGIGRSIGVEQEPEVEHFHLEADEDFHLEAQTNSTGQKEGSL